jgi:hypothetical protein
VHVLSYPSIVRSQTQRSIKAEEEEEEERADDDVLRG